ncbi:MAG: hypothetical protein U0271_09135 [Polyangiaceae bacterium]
MDDKDKAALAKRGLKAMDLTKSGEISKRVKSSVKETAGNVALRGLAVFGKKESEREAAAPLTDTGPSFESFDRGELGGFDRRLEQAFNRPAETWAKDELDEALAASPAERKSSPKSSRSPESSRSRKRASAPSLAELRRSFPQESRQLAQLVFSCTDLLEEIARGDRSTSVAELERREQMLARIAELLEPKASSALVSFVAHTVKLSKGAR